MFSNKSFKTYSDQLQLIESRGMSVSNGEAALNALQNTNYYRLSGYWYPFREIGEDGSRLDTFYPGSSFDSVMALYEFDEMLRSTALRILNTLEIALRARLAYVIAEFDPYLHLAEQKLNLSTPGLRAAYEKWYQRYRSQIDDPHEEFVEHYNSKYGGKLPIWVAVELLEWGGLSYLYSFCPRKVQLSLSDSFGLTTPQLSGWLRELNKVRNICAHHGRLFNRILNKPKMPDPWVHQELDAVCHEWNRNRVFTHLTLIQFLAAKMDLNNLDLLPRVIDKFPDVETVPIEHMGVTDNWRYATPLWKTKN